jgi:membrane protein
MLATLFGAMVVVVGSAALEREVHEELRRVRRGERTPDDEDAANGTK